MLKPLLTAAVLERILKDYEEGATASTVSLDLGLSKAQVRMSEGGLGLPDGTTLPWEVLQPVLDHERRVYVVEEQSIREASAFSEVTGWVRSLTPTSGAPTVLVSGIPMHRIKGTDPHKDTLTKIAAIEPLRGRVLDTATGLGYTAIEAAKKGTEVVTVEYDPAAIEIARLNPWSQKLFENPRITQIIGDVEEVVDTFRDGEFSAVIHDPPTIQLAGELYSGDFYKQLRRVLSRNGKLFHYIGDPESGIGHRITQGVMRRLSEAGFKKVVRKPEAFGVAAFV